MMREDLIDSIYEAAFVPELWPDVLTGMSAVTHSVGGIFFATGAHHHPPRWTASMTVRDLFSEFVSDAAAPANDRPSRFLHHGYAGFLRDLDFLPPGHLEREPLQHWLKSNGLGWEVGTVFPMPSGETVVLGLERRFSDGPHPASVLALLDGLRPHLARAGLLAARLGLERAQMAVATLEAIGLPAAALAASGRVLAVNALVESSPALLPIAHGGLAIAHSSANRLFRQAILDAQSGRGTPVRSIPVPGSEEHPAAIVHVLPLRGEAHDIFSGAATLVVITAVGMSEMAPGTALLHGLFDLSPAEARLATALASGRSLKDAARNGGIQFSTARSYLEHIFRKTGTRQQSQLVALLKSTQQLLRSS